MIRPSRDPSAFPSLSPSATVPAADPCAATRRASDAPAADGRRRALLALGLGAAATLAGCVVAPVGARRVYRDRDDGGYYGGNDGYDDGEVVTVAPPEPRYEVVGVAPFVGALWIGGHWNWAGGAYAWVPGYWSRPRPGYRYHSPRWQRHGRGWRQDRGGWRADRGGGRRGR